MSTASEAPAIRVVPGQDDHAAGLLALIEPIFAEYPGVLFDPEGEMPELYTIATSYGGAGGDFWSAFVGERLVGCVGYVPTAGDRGVELRKLYVAADQRRHGLASRLTELVEAAALERPGRFVELWSDVKFIPAHRFYEARGYVRDGRSRELHDQSDTVEYYFRRQLGPAVQASDQRRR